MELTTKLYSFYDYPDNKYFGQKWKSLTVLFTRYASPALSFAPISQLEIVKDKFGRPLRMQLPDNCFYTFLFKTVKIVIPYYVAVTTYVGATHLAGMVTGLDSSPANHAFGGWCTGALYGIYKEDWYYGRHASRYLAIVALIVKTIDDFTAKVPKLGKDQINVYGGSREPIFITKNPPRRWVTEIENDDSEDSDD